MTLKERIDSFLEYKKITRSFFEKASGLSNGYTRNIKGSIGNTKLSGILNAFPEINKVWLITGEGEMIKAEEPYNETVHISSMKSRLIQIAENYGLSVAEFERKAGLSNGYIKNFKGSIGSDKIEYLLSRFPEIDPGWLLTGEGEMLKSPEVRAERAVISFSKGVPFYNESFECGFNDLEPSSVVNPDFLVQMPGYAAASLWCRATGASMEPEISSGDLIALQRVNNLSNIIFGEIYAIVTSNGLRTVKRVRKSDTKGCIRLVPANPEYDEQDIPVVCITFIYRVLGALKSF